MKTNKILKVTCIILIIVLLTLLSFVGIFVKDNGRLVNKIKDFTKGSEFGTEREYVFALSESTKTEYYDGEGNLVPDDKVDKNATEGTYTTKEVSVNSQEAKTSDNYNLAKAIMEKRLKNLGIQEYRLTVDENKGDIVLKTNVNEETEDMLYAMYGKGEFLLKDSETEEVLLNNNDIENVKVGYHNEETGTTVYLSINLNKEGTKKLEEISSKYTQTTETKDVTADDGTVSQKEETITKKVKLYIDGTMIIDTYFGETIKNGQLQLTMGKSTTDPETLQNSLMTATTEATVLSFGAMPLVYSATQSSNILSVFDSEMIAIIISILILVALVVLIYYVIRYKERGIMASILFVGFTALYVLVIRYANVPITYASVAGFIFIELFNIYFIDRILYKLKHYNISEETPNSILNKNIIRYISVLMPALIIGVVCALFTMLGLSSFGMIVFWGILLFVLYSYLFTKTLLLNFEYLFEE